MIIPVLRLLRPYYTIPFSCGFLVITSYIVGGDFSRFNITLVYAYISLFLVLSAGYVLNDVCDIRIDRINNPNRPIAKGQITQKAALILSTVLFAAGLAFAPICRQQFFIVLAMIAIGLVLYNLYSKKLSFFKDVLAGALMTSLYPLAFAFTEPVETDRLRALCVFPVWLFLTSLGYEMLKDIRDVKGDRLNSNVKPVAASPRFLLFARAFILLASLIAISPYLLGYCRFVYLISSLFAIALAVYAVMLPPVKAIPFIYAEVFVITAGSMADLLVYGP